MIKSAVSTTIKHNNNGRTVLDYLSVVETLPDSNCGTRCRRSTYGINFPFLFPTREKFDPEKPPNLQVTGLSTLNREVRETS